MHQHNIESWKHLHIFGQDKKQTGERKTLIVMTLSAAMMMIEIAAGSIFGSMALLADGLHMASHTFALCINVFAYIYARRHAYDKSFSFGTGKVNTLGGFTGAALLGVFALLMTWESSKRFFHPVEIAFDQAISVAIIGLVVNALSATILNIKEGPAKGEAGHHHHDHNLQSAYLHVLADALTSILAIFALVMAKYFALLWMDPFIGILGAALIFKWSWQLIKTTSGILLDKQVPGDIEMKIREAIEIDGDSKITDLHLWFAGPHIYNAIISIVAHHPLEPEEYKRLIPSNLGVVHVTVEVFKCKAAGSCSPVEEQAQRTK